MATARYRRRLTRNWFRLRERKPVGWTTRLATAAILVTGAAVTVAVPALTATPASADTTTQNFTSAGIQTVTVPQYVTSFSVTGLGGAGLPGQASSGNASPGGAGGTGSSISETFDPIPSDIHPGDILQFEVGAAGGGAAGGTGDGLSGAGGAGGGYTYVSDQTTGETLLIAAGGGGGGGGSGLFVDYVGGNGGTDGGGSPGYGQLGAATGNPGAEGSYCPNSTPAITDGNPGQNAPTASADGGGGGGGGGGCGGSGGQAQAGSGGGGGGSGYSVLDSDATSKTLSSGSNTGDGSASVTFTTSAANVAPTFGAGNCVYSANGGALYQDIEIIGQVNVRALPDATLSLIGQPGWLTAVNEATTNSDGTDETTYDLDTVNGMGYPPIVDGQYTFEAEAANSVGSLIEPFTVVEEPGVTQPTFLSADTATATVGTPFSFQVSAVGCPAITTYRISSNPADVPWLTLDPNTGVLSGTPTAADAGTQTISVTASPEGGTPITQTFTLTVNGPAATAPGAPTIGTAIAGNGQATVTFTPPASNGGSPITGYTVTATDATNPGGGGQTFTGTSSPITVTHLTNGDRYTFTVTATNAIGTGPASTPSKAVTPEAPKPSADLMTALSRHPSAKDGSTFTETVTVTNHGPSAAPDLVTKVILPGQLSVVSTHGGRQAGAVISWTDASLGVDKSVSYTVTVKVAARAQGTVLIAATIISTAKDPNPLNNWAITAIKLG